MPLESTQHQQLLSVYSMPGTEEWDWARQILPPEEFTHPLGEIYVIGRQMGPVGHERAQNPVCVADKETVPVYTGVARGVAVPPPWIYEVERRGGVGKKLRAGGTS